MIGWKRLAACVVGVTGLLITSGLSADEPHAAGGPPELRRLTEAQYRQIIADVFSPDIGVAGRFDPLPRNAGLLEIGASQAAINPSGYEQLEALARNISGQVVDARHRDYLIPCKPAAVTAPDDACAKQFLGASGRLLFRRAVSEAEVQRAVAVAHQAASDLHDFYSGLAMALAGQLSAPDFLFVADRTEPDPDRPGHDRLTAYSKAARLSFFLWNTAPDEVLLAAAEKGELHKASGLRRQVDRMLASPRVESGLRAFFADMLAFDSGTEVNKDPVIYPAFKPIMVNEAQEQTLRTIIDQILTRHGDYRDLFTTRHTFITRDLALLYRLPVDAPDSIWVPYDFASGDPRGGIVTQISFLASHSHPGRSSATLRGRAIREILLCQKVPDPPPNVDFSLVQNTNNPKFKTARERQTAHATSPACAGCHKIIDPIGLTLETFDGAGQFRTTENGAPIDVSGQLGDRKFNGPVELGQALHDEPAVNKCLVDRLYDYSVGRPTLAADREWVDNLEKQFAGDHYRVDLLLRRIATSDALYAIADRTQTALLTKEGGQP